MTRSHQERISKEGEVGTFERGIIHSLGRTDKWFLGGGGPLLWAPPFPSHPWRPGFWDQGQFFRHWVGPLFTVDILDPSGEPLDLTVLKHRWNPAYLLCESRAGTQVTLVERRAVLPSGCAASELCLESSTPTEVVVAAWTVQPCEGVATVEEGCLAIPRRLPRPVGGSDTVWLALRVGPQESEATLVGAEAGVPGPWWRLSALWDSSARCEPPRDGFVHAGLKVRLRLRTGEPSLVGVSMALATDRQEAVREASRWVVPGAHPVEACLRQWEDFFSQVPVFECSDEFLRTFYWYRWFGLRLCTQAPGAGLLRPTVTEGIGYFRRAITYSAPAHVRETKWMHTPELAQRELEVFFGAQEPAGRFPGIVDVEGVIPESFYHADWGKAAEELLVHHPDPAFQAAAYSSLSAYARWLFAERDPEGSGMITVENHYETGQEYSRRYLAVDPSADTQHWGKKFALKGVDATVYAYRLLKALEALAPGGSPGPWPDLAERVASAVRTKMWDPAARMFFDVDPSTGARTGVFALTGFYPFMTDLVDSSHTPALLHLFDPRRFWTEFPFPTLPLDDPLFDPEGRWKGVRMNCPWNGRTWPMTNSHVVEALATHLSHAPHLAPQVAEALRRVVRLFFLHRDPSRPTSFEHYNPLTGKPSLYRGVDDYQHSWVVDQLITYVAGLQPLPEGLRIAPLPMGLEFVRLSRARVRGREVELEVEEGRVTRLSVDGRARQVDRLPCEVPWD